MPDPELEKKWQALLKTLESVHRFLFMYLRMTRLTGRDGDAVVLTVDDEEKFKQVEDGLTQYAASLGRYLPSQFGPNVHLILQLKTPGAPEGGDAPTGADGGARDLDPEELFRLGQAAVQEGKREEGMGKLLAAAEGFSKGGLKVKGKQVLALQEFLKLDAENLKARRALADALEQEGLQEAAGYEYLRLASRLLEQGDLEAAFASASQAVKNRQAEGQLLLAQIHAKQNQADLAALALQEFLQEKPRHSGALKQLLGLARQKGDTDEILKVALRLCQADPAEPAGYEALADVYEFQGQYIKAHGMLLQAAEAYLNHNQFDQAERLIQRVLSKDSSHPVAGRLWQRLLQVHPTAPRGTGPAAVLRTAVHPSQITDPGALKPLSTAEINEGLKHFDLAIAAYRQLLRLEPDNEACRAKLNLLYKIMAQANECQL